MSELLGTQTNVQKLKEKLDSMGATIGGFSRGTNTDATAEEVSEQILKAIEAVESGDFEDVTNCDD